MTINKLVKELQRLQEKGHGRSSVQINKASFYHPLESDGAVIMPVGSVAFMGYPIMDDDGGTATDRRGREKYSVALVIYGSDKE